LGIQARGGNYLLVADDPGIRTAEDVDTGAVTQFEEESLAE